jgi:hypothetical protein
MGPGDRDEDFTVLRGMASFDHDVVAGLEAPLLVFGLGIGGEPEHVLAHRPRANGPPDIDRFVHDADVDVDPISR